MCLIADRQSEGVWDVLMITEGSQSRDGGGK